MLYVPILDLDTGRRVYTAVPIILVLVPRFISAKKEMMKMNLSSKKGLFPYCLSDIICSCTY